MVLMFVAPILLALATPALAQTVAVLPPSQSVFSGNPFSVDISISDVTDLYAFQFDLGFDPQVINATGITEGPFLATGGPTFFLPGTVDNASGTIAFTADTLQGPIAGVSGDGLLAVATFEAFAPGSSELDLENLFFLDSTGGGISVTIQSGEVSVLATPEPPSITLSWAGVLGCLIAGTFVRRYCARKPV
jgi:general secretion pathway protein D